MGSISKNSASKIIPHLERRVWLTTRRVSSSSTCRRQPRIKQCARVYSNGSVTESPSTTAGQRASEIPLGRNSCHTACSYRFLGFTESQVKAGKLMFFREDHEWTVQRLLSSFGDLPSVYLKSGYGKYSARLGLSFSSTVESMDVRYILV